MRSKITGILVLVFLFFFTCLPGLAAEGGALPFTLQSEAAVLLEHTSREILVAKNSDKRLPPASVTKMMVMLLVMEAVEAGKVNLNDTVVTSPEAARMGGSQIWLEPGE